MLAPLLADYHHVFKRSDAKGYFERMEFGLCILVGAGKAGAVDPIAGCFFPRLIRQVGFTPRFFFRWTREIQQTSNGDV